MGKNKDLKEVDEAVVVIWMPMLRSLPKNDHKCPCYPEEHGFCPCLPFIEKLECRCGLFIVRETYDNTKIEDWIKRVKLHGQS